MPARNTVSAFGLTRRQLAFLAYVALGYRFKEVAFRMGTTVPALKQLSVRIRRKLGVDGLVDAYRKIGWLNVPIDSDPGRVHSGDRDKRTTS